MEQGYVLIFLSIIFGAGRFRRLSKNPAQPIMRKLWISVLGYFLGVSLALDALSLLGFREQSLIWLPYLACISFFVGVLLYWVVAAGLRYKRVHPD
jgi:uncharacterized membrane protein